MTRSPLEGLGGDASGGYTLCSADYTTLEVLQLRLIKLGILSNVDNMLKCEPCVCGGDFDAAMLESEV